jgi:hypothetical protein
VVASGSHQLEWNTHPDITPAGYDITQRDMYLNVLVASYVQLGRACLAHDPESRPGLPDIILCLQELRLLLLAMDESKS